jgi:hypothetical protein
LWQIHGHVGQAYGIKDVQKLVDEKLLNNPMKKKGSP